jgi:hypothetical protein
MLQVTCTDNIGYEVALYDEKLSHSYLIKKLYVPKKTEQFCPCNPLLPWETKLIKVRTLGTKPSYIIDIKGDEQFIRQVLVLEGVKKDNTVVPKTFPTLLTLTLATVRGYQLQKDLQKGILPENLIKLLKIEHRHERIPSYGYTWCYEMCPYFRHDNKNGGRNSGRT